MVRMPAGVHPEIPGLAVEAEKLVVVDVTVHVFYIFFGDEKGGDIFIMQFKRVVGHLSFQPTVHQFPCLGDIQLALVSDDPQTAAQEGEIGWAERGRLLREVEDAAFSLAPGEFAGPVRSLVGYHVVLVEDRREAWRPGLFDIRERLAAEYGDEMFRLYAAETLAGLRASAERDGRLSFPKE